MREPGEPLFVENIGTDSRIDGAHRADFIANYPAYRTRSEVVLALYSGGRWHGSLVIIWFDEPHQFTDQEKYVYTQLLQTLPSVVATRRAYLAEQEARQENELLYRLSQDINAAKTFHEITQAVAQIDTNSEAVTLGIWENYDFEQASYAEFMAAYSRTNRFVFPRGQKVPLEFRQTTQLMPRQGFVIVENVLTNSHISPATAKTMVEEFNIHAFLSAPLNIQGRWLGAFHLLSSEPRQFSKREQRLATGIGDLVTAAVERIRLQQETELSRQQAEILAEVSAALSQAADEHEILSAVARLAEGYGGDLSILAYIVSIEGNPLDRVNIVALRAGDAKRPVPLNTLPVISFRLTDYPLLRLVETNPNEPVFIEDVFSDPRTEDGNTREFSRRVEWGAAVMIPLKTGDHWQGTLTLVWKEKRLFSTEVRKLFTAIQPAVASVVAHRRAYLAEQQRAHQLETVAKVSAAATSILKEKDLLDTIAELTQVSFKQYHFIIYLLEHEGRNLVQATSFAENPYSHDIEPERLSISLDNERSLVARAAQMRQGIIVNDIENTTEYSLTPMIRNARSEMAVPMVAADKLVGVLDVQSRELNRFTESDIWVMATLADLIAVAIQNARLYQQAQELAIFEERNRLARELHDSVSQALYGIALGARTARKLLERDPSRLSEPLDYVLSLAEAGLTEMRALIFDLRPDSLEEEGLLAALSKQMASIQARHGIQMKTEFGEEPALPLEIKESLYWIAREALHNTVKHAQASQVLLSVNCDADEILMEIKDNGLGFDISSAFPGHLGLHTMRERATRLNGLLEIESASGRGTQIRVHIPHVADKTS
jgi:signal transduction histidine kinase